MTCGCGHEEMGTNCSHEGSDFGTVPVSSSSGSEADEYPPEVIHLAMRVHEVGGAWGATCGAVIPLLHEDKSRVTCARCLELQDQFESGAFV